MAGTGPVYPFSKPSSVLPSLGAAGKVSVEALLPRIVYVSDDAGGVVLAIEEDVLAVAQEEWTSDDEGVWYTEGPRELGRGRSGSISRDLRFVDVLVLEPRRCRLVVCAGGVPLSSRSCCCIAPFKSELTSRQSHQLMSF